MEDNIKNIILIGNSTFTFTEDKPNANNEQACQDNKSKYPGEIPEKQNRIPFKTITITSVGNSSGQPTCQNAAQHIEPCTFNNGCGQFGYFTQDFSNVTVYLNDTSLLNKENNEIKSCSHWNTSCNIPDSSMPDAIENYSFFSNENPVDFPFIDTENMTNKIEIDETMQYLNIFNNKIENDAPEYIDINSLVIPTTYSECYNNDNKKKSTSVPPFLKRNRRSKVKLDITDGDEKSNEDGDDVIFIKEYKNNEDKKDEPTKKVQKSFPEPRRNPTRQVQLQKVSYELATKLSMEGYYEYRKHGTKERYMTNTRRSTRTTGAVFTPPLPLKFYDSKEWPVEGMHEKPSFDPVTNKLQKLPNVPKKVKLSGARSVSQYNRKKAPNSKKKISKEEQVETNKEFASVAHNTFHHVLSYIEQIKEYNMLIKSHSIEGNKKPANLEKAEDILLDSSVLYSIANDVQECSISNYLETISEKEKVNEFLRSIIEDCESATIEK